MVKDLFRKLFFHSPKRTFLVVGGLIVMLALPITVLLTQQQQDLRQEASIIVCGSGYPQQFGSCLEEGHTCVQTTQSNNPYYVRYSCVPQGGTDSGFPGQTSSGYSCTTTGACGGGLVCCDTDSNPSTPGTCMGISACGGSGGTNTTCAGQSQSPSPENFINCCDGLNAEVIQYVCVNGVAEPIYVCSSYGYPAGDPSFQKPNCSSTGGQTDPCTSVFNRPDGCYCGTTSHCESRNCVGAYSDPITGYGQAGTCQPKPTATPTKTPTPSPTKAPSPTATKTPTPTPDDVANTPTLTPTGTQGLTCDPTGDGKIDIFDFNVWRDEYLTKTVTTKKSACFADSKEEVDIFDFNVWRDIAILKTRQPF